VLLSSLIVMATTVVCGSSGRSLKAAHLVAFPHPFGTFVEKDYNHRGRTRILAKTSEALEDFAELLSELQTQSS
jgi:hypothetical protein